MQTRLRLNNHGYILILALFFMLSISFLSASLLQSSALNTSMAHFDQDQLQSFHAAEWAIAEGENALPQGGCEVPFSTQQNFAQTDWWKSNKTCHSRIDMMNYQYIISKIFIDPCAMVGNKKGGIYYQVTARGASIDNLTQTILQTIYFIPSAINTVCSEQFHTLHPGRQSWRELSPDFD